MSFEIIPAIDLLDGHCVRLVQGDFEKTKVYERDAAALASDYAQAGAEWLHVVDLAASRDGPAADTAALFRLLKGAPQSVQTGGGVRTRHDVALRLENGARRVVVGSIGVEQPERFAAWIRELGTDRLVAALDVRVEQDGTPRPRTRGWTRRAATSLWELLDFYADHGLRHLLCTDIGRDGALSGPNEQLYREISGRYPDFELQASGGVRSLGDLRRLAASGAAAAITGKALLEGRFDLAEALEEFE